jgi:putative phosphoribosyl transferase
MIYRNRSEAGKHLAAKLTTYANRDDVLVLALPRGGVPVAFEVAKALSAPLDVFLVRKLGLPGHEELAMGAIATGGVRVLNDDVVDYLEISDVVIDAIAAIEFEELERRERVYRGGRPEPDMSAAVSALRQLKPARIVVAVPVSAPQTCDEYRMGVDEIICAVTPKRFYGVGRWYRDFSQTTDEEVSELLERSRSQQTENQLAHS